MKMFLMSVSLICINFFNLDVQANVERFLFNSKVLEVSFDRHNSSDLKQLQSGKAMVSSTLNKFAAIGLKPRKTFLEVLIAPEIMSGGNIVELRSRIYMSVSASDLEIEKKFLQFFVLASEVSNVEYFGQNNPSLHEFIYGAQKIETVLAKLNINPEYKLNLGISSQNMSGGRLVKFNGKLYFSNEASAEEIEMFLIKHFAL